MLIYCLKCKRNTEDVGSKTLKTKNGRTKLSSNCVLCGSKKSHL